MRAEAARTAAPANPFADPVACANSNYCAFDGRALVGPDGAPAAALTRLVHGALRGLVLSDGFSCVGAKAALRQGTYRFGLYEELGSDAAAAGLARDLFTFVADAPSWDASFATYIASFREPAATDEPTFERLLWRTLQQLHDLDAGLHPWDPSVSDQPDDPQFAFSFAGRAFFVVGLHAGASRAIRRFAWPTLVFNPHAQFEKLRADGRYGRMQHVIRRAERELEGDINPMLADHGTRSAATQYAGRRVDEAWRCPFSARTPRTEEG